MTIGKTTLRGNELYMTLRALERSKSATMLSSPRVTTVPNQPAIIQMVRRIPYVFDFETTNLGTADQPIVEETYSIAEKVTGIILEVTPRIGAEEDIITLDISPTVSFVTDTVPVSARTPPGLGWPVVEMRSTKTSVVIRSGETIVLGGLITDDEETTSSKVPVLGNIPLLGRLFRRDDKTRVKKNLIIFLSATLIDAEGRPAKTSAAAAPAMSE